MVRDTSVTALKEPYQMETFRTSRMTAPGAAAGGLSSLRAARSGSLVWPTMYCSSCSTTIPARSSAVAFRFPCEHPVKARYRSASVQCADVDLEVELVGPRGRRAGPSRPPGADR